MFKSFPEETLYAFPVPSVFGIDDTWTALNSGARRKRNGPLAVYIHVPFCSSICHFCGFTRTSKFNNKVISEHTKYAIKELDLIVEKFELEGRRIDSIFFGGGTASLLPTDQIEKLLAAVESKFRIDKQTDFTFEGDVKSLQRSGYIKDLSNLGFKRLSFGIQTTNSDMRSVLNLKPAISEIVEVASTASDYFPEVCADFIYGWPGQTSELLMKDLNYLVSEVPVNSIDLFQFEKLDANPNFMNMLYKANIRDLSTTELQELRRCVIEGLFTADYIEKSSTYFTKLSEPTSPVSYGSCYYGYDESAVIGIGRGAQSFLNGKMWGNALDYKDWRDRLDRGFIPTISYGEYERGEREAVNWPRRGHLPFDSEYLLCNSIYQRKLNNLIELGYIKETLDSYTLTLKGRDWIPSILEFLMSEKQLTSYRREMQRFSDLLTVVDVG